MGDKSEKAYSKNKCDFNKMKNEESVSEEPISISGKVLIVEDNEINMEITAELLKMLKLEAREVCNGNQAVEAMKTSEENEYSLILMDIQMPDISGYEATYQIREFEKQTGREPIPIIALSADAFVEDLGKAQAAGMNDYITKPIDFAKVERVIRSYLIGKD